MSDRLSSREVRLAQVLSEGSDLFEAVQGERDRTAAVQDGKNRYREALSALRGMSEGEGIPIAIIGGLATVYHGYQRFTKDIDVVVSVQDFGRLIRVCHDYGFRATTFNQSGFNDLDYQGVHIEVIQEGAFGVPGDESKAMLSPGELGVESGLGFAGLEQWVKLKMGRSERQDETDIVEVLKRLDPARVEGIRGYLGQFDPKYLRRFLNLVHEAAVERERREAFWGKGRGYSA